MPLFNEKQVMKEVNFIGIMEKRNVTTAYPGTKKVRGIDTGEPCVVIGVRNKMDKRMLEKRDLIPKTIPSGVKTDVVVIGRIRPLTYENPEPYWRTSVYYDTFERYMETNDPNCAGVRFNTAPSLTYGCPRHSWKHRPIIGGVSIGTYFFDYYSAVLGYVWQEGGTGTLGAIVRDKADGKIVILTNNHVLARDVVYYDTNYKVPSGGQQSIMPGTYIAQPGKRDFNYWYRVEDRISEIYGGAIDEVGDAGDYDERVIYNAWMYDQMVVGEAKRIVPVQFGTDSDQDNQVDCGVASIDRDLAFHGIWKGHLGPYPFAARDEYTTGDPIYISSRSMGFRDPDNEPVPYIASVDAITNVNYNGGDESTAKFTDQIMFTTEDTNVTRGGDSGSVLLKYASNVYKIVGLLFAGTGDRMIGYANHIDNVADQLNIEPWDGKITVNADDYGASFNETCYHKIKTVKKSISHIPDYVYGNCEECKEPVTVSYADDTGYNKINAVVELPVKGEVTIEKEIFIWFDRDDPQNRMPVGDYKIVDVRLSVACMNGEFSGQSNIQGQECVDEKWISARSDGVRTYYWDEMTDDNQTVYKPIGGGFVDAEDYLSLGDFALDSARRIYLKMIVPEGVESEGAVFPKLVVQYNVENTSSSSESNSSSSVSSLSSSSSSNSSSSESISSSSSSSWSGSASSSSSSSSSESISSSSSFSSSESSSSQSSMSITPADCSFDWNSVEDEGTATASTEGGGNPPSLAIDDDTDTRWRAWTGAEYIPAWWKIDFGAANEKQIEKLRIYGGASFDLDRNPKDWELQASNTGSFSGEETVLLSRYGTTWTESQWEEWDFANATAYRYYRIYITAVELSPPQANLTELELQECYSSSSSESTSSSSSSSESESSSSSSESKEFSSSSSSSSYSSESVSSSSSSYSSESVSSSSSSSSSSSESESSSSSSSSSSLFVASDYAWDAAQTDSSLDLSNENRTAAANQASALTTISKWSKSSGKWYWEIALGSGGTNFQYSSIGICDVSGGTDFDETDRVGWDESWAQYDTGSTPSWTYHDGAFVDSSYGATWGDNDILMVAVDIDNGKIWWGANDTWWDSGDPANGTNPGMTDATINTIISACITLRNDNNDCTCRFRSSELSYSIPSGFSAIDA